ncbi:MAG: AIR synthase-related protein [Chthoniobacter sp.]
MRALIKSHLVKSAHDLSEGGLGVALAESILAHPNPPVLPLGAVIELGDTRLRLDQLLFNETQGRIVLSVKPSDVSPILMLLELRGIAARRIGTVGGDLLKSLQMAPRSPGPSPSCAPRGTTASPKRWARRGRVSPRLSS